jgi:hypothetical protein
VTAKKYPPKIASGFVLTHKSGKANQTMSLHHPNLIAWGVIGTCTIRSCPITGHLLRNSIDLIFDACEKKERDGRPVYDSTLSDLITWVKPSGAVTYSAETRFPLTQVRLVGLPS